MRELYANLEWRSAMTIPRSLSLTRTSEGIRLISKPIEELTGLRGESPADRNYRSHLPGSVKQWVGALQQSSFVYYPLKSIHARL